MKRNRAAGVIGGVFASMILVAFAMAGGSTAPDSAGASLPPDKQGIQDDIDMAQAAGQMNPAPKSKSNPDPLAHAQVENIAPVGGAPAGAGLLFVGSDMSTPPTDRDDTFTSAWSVIGTTKDIDIWAGARGKSAKQGFVMVLVWDATRTRIIGGDSYDSPKVDGILTITGANDQVVSLVAGDGTKLEFDAAAQVFR